MTHTPSPWLLWSSKDGGFTISAGYQDEAVICQRSDWDHRATESVDNGRLIAAAPELLAAALALEKAEEFHANCKDCDGAEQPELCPACFPFFDDARCMRRAAIAKAEGRL